MATDLADMKCVPCRGGVPALSADEADVLLKRLRGWQIVEEHKLNKSFPFKNFVEAVDFVNRITTVAEEEGHHPDLYVRWGEVRVYLWTHKVNGLTESDFFMAAKIDRVSETGANP